MSTNLLTAFILQRVQFQGANPSTEFRYGPRDVQAILFDAPVDAPVATDVPLFDAPVDAPVATDVPDSLESPRKKRTSDRQRQQGLEAMGTDKLVKSCRIEEERDERHVIFCYCYNCGYWLLFCGSGVWSVWSVSLPGRFLQPMTHHSLFHDLSRVFLEKVEVGIELLNSKSINFKIYRKFEIQVDSVLRGLDDSR